MSCRSTPQENDLTSEPQPLQVTADIHQQVALLTRALGVGPNEVIARLLHLYTQPAAPTPPNADTTVPVYAIYQHHRIEGRFDTSTGAMTIPAGPGAGEYRTASGAARAVVTALRPQVSPIRTGWTFWRLSENGAYLETIRAAGPYRRTRGVPSALPPPSPVTAAATPRRP